MTIFEKILFHLLQGSASLFRLLGFSGLKTFGKLSGYLIWHFVPERRRLAVENVQKHLNTDAETSLRIAYESFLHNGQSFAEILLTKKFGIRSPLLHIQQKDLMEALRRCDRPIVATTAHFGAWELLASILGQIYSSPRPRMVVVRRYPNEVVQTFIASCREATGAEMVGHRRIAPTVLKALHKNGIVAFLADHNAHREEAAFLPFLGEQAAVNVGPALLAIRAKALIWPLVLRREPNGYSFLLKPPLDTALLEGTLEEKIHTAALFYTQAIESFVQDNPEQWFWMHDRWKTKQ